MRRDVLLDRRERTEDRRKLVELVSPGGVQRVMSQPIGMKTKPSRRTGLAAVFASGRRGGNHRIQQRQRQRRSHARAGTCAAA